MHKGQQPSHSDWGADRAVLTRLYDTFVRSKLDYGSIVYGSARKTYLQILNPVQNLGLRLITGAFRTSPADSLQIETNEQPLSLRREKLALQYTIKLASNKLNPTHNTTFKPNAQRLFVLKPNSIPTIGIRLQPSLTALNICHNDVALFTVPRAPPWTLAEPQVIFSVGKHKKIDENKEILLKSFSEIEAKYRDYTHIYTDGSKDGEQVASAAVIGDHVVQSRLPDKCSIFTAELKAIQMALEYIRSSRKTKFVIFSDSKSVLQALHNLKTENALILLTITEHQHLVSTGKSIVFCWIPSHIGIAGNDKADAAAGLARQLAITNLKIPHTDLRMSINKYITGCWQDSWNSETTNKLHEVTPSIGERPHYKRQNRKEEVVLCRLRIGHTHLTHCYLLKGDAQPECATCQCPLTIKHILLECTHYKTFRPNGFHTASMKDFFE